MKVGEKSNEFNKNPYFPFTKEQFEKFENKIEENGGKPSFPDMKVGEKNNEFNKNPYFPFTKEQFENFENKIKENGGKSDKFNQNPYFPFTKEQFEKFQREIEKNRKKEDKKDKNYKRPASDLDKKQKELRLETNTMTISYTPTTLKYTYKIKNVLTDKVTQPTTKVQDVPIIEVEDTETVTKVKDVQPTSEVEDTPSAAKVEDVQPIYKIKNIQPITKVKFFEPAAEVEDAQPAAKVEDVQPTNRVDDTQPVAEIENSQSAAKMKDFEPAAEVEDTQPTSKFKDTQQREEVKDVQSTNEVEDTKPMAEIKNLQSAVKVEVAEFEDFQPTTKFKNTQPAAKVGDTQSETNNFKDEKLTTPVKPPTNIATNVQPATEVEYVQPTATQSTTTVKITTDAKKKNASLLNRLLKAKKKLLGNVFGFEMVNGRRSIPIATQKKENINELKANQVPPKYTYGSIIGKTMGNPDVLEDSDYVADSLNRSSDENEMEEPLYSSKSVETPLELPDLYYKNKSFGPDDHSLSKSLLPIPLASKVLYVPNDEKSFISPAENIEVN